MTSERTTANAIHKTVHVELDAARAFDAFTAEMGAWWPLATHSVGQADAKTVTCDAVAGGEIVEQLADGSTSVWGTIIECDRPHQLRFTWHPGHAESEATEVEVRFTPQADGTLVELIHTGWDRRADGTAARENYDSGWDFVLGRYAKAPVT